MFTSDIQGEVKPGRRLSSDYPDWEERRERQHAHAYERCPIPAFALFKDAGSAVATRLVPFMQINVMKMVTDARLALQVVSVAPREGLTAARRKCRSFCLLARLKECSLFGSERGVYTFRFGTGTRRGGRNTGGLSLVSDLVVVVPEYRGTP